MSNGQRFMCIALMTSLTAACATAWSQSATVEKQFADYHAALSETADAMLATTLDQHSAAKGDTLGAPELPPALPTKAFSSAIRRVRRLRPLLEPILREQGVPANMMAVVLVESGGQPTALSRKGARGLWQLMPATARRYGLTVSTARDERLDLTAATRAAARYLRDLHAQFGNWQLAFAAYNGGEQAVLRAMSQSGRSDFQHLNSFLPAETQAYVPAVLAALSLFGSTQQLTELVLRAAETANVLYASARLD